jgi:hypothetical protein
MYMYLIFRISVQTRWFVMTVTKIINELIEVFLTGNEFFVIYVNFYTFNPFSPANVESMSMHYPRLM